VFGDGVVGSEDCFVAELGEREAEVDVTKVGKKERGGGGRRGEYWVQRVAKRLRDKYGQRNLV
jgi:hypothetical protein